MSDEPVEGGHPLMAHEAVILTNKALNAADISAVNSLLAKRLARRYVGERPAISSVFITGRSFELDFRPMVLSKRYPIDGE